jgi:hypothetical protein
MSRGSNESTTVSKSDKEILRSLAKQVIALAARPSEQEKAGLWKKLNKLERVRPLISCHPQNGWVELITPADLKCEGSLARKWEEPLRQEVFLGTRVTHDRLQMQTFDIEHVYTESDWGMHERRIGGNGGSGSAEEALAPGLSIPAQGGRNAYAWEAPFRDYDEDLKRLRFPVISVNDNESNRILELAQGVFSGIMPVRLRTDWYWTMGITYEVAKLRGIQQMMMDMYDHPQGFHALMAFVRDGINARLDFLEKNGLLALNYREGMYEGELPQPGFDPGHVRTMDLLGFAESQETVGVSPDMFEEFIFPYQASLLERFGINHYGCCEPLDGRIGIVKRLSRLRRVTVSPWANLPFMAESLGDRYILFNKPHPALLAARNLDEELVRSTLRQAYRTTRDCRVEICLADTNTFSNNPDNLTRWSQIAMEEAAAV